ncbi:unnamed protein product, partial [Rotaria sp. Silwood2]
RTRSQVRTTNIDSEEVHSEQDNNMEQLTTNINTLSFMLTIDKEHQHLQEMFAAESDGK